ncbi:MAG TPA: PilX N-terminal domain-containing pilus assembly protein [Deltaproteobacteria bacterium]|nr:PilX N-terminal domain-containing pilus assembly protein [Deltaproteobacteria bacterium]HOI06526.1 PilX N-terminal domain-containing pilus assembly protein [Deltaproteobacteria bacterium]
MENLEGCMKANNGVRIAGSERGAILMVVLIVLIVTIVVGITLMKTTAVDTKIAGSDIVYQRDFYVCEAAGELAKERFDAIVSTMEMNESVNSTVNISNSMNGVGPIRDAKVTISFLRSSTPPVSSGTSPSSAFANYYVIRSTVNGKTIEKGVWKAFPKSE